MQDKLSQFLFATYDPYKMKLNLTISVAQEIANAIVEINGLFIDSNVYLRSFLISMYANDSEPGKINRVSKTRSWTLAGF